MLVVAHNITALIAGDDPDELEVYGTDTANTGPLLTSYKFEVHTPFDSCLFCTSSVTRD